MIKKLEEKRCELEELEDTNSTLIIKERQSTGEIQEAFTELIRVIYLRVIFMFLSAVLPLV